MYNIRSKSVQNKKGVTDSGANIVTTYAESCLKLVSEDALFYKIGLQGGYIDPNEIPNEQRTSFLSISVPYYLEAICTETRCSFKDYIPDEDKIIERLSDYIIVEFQKCFDKTIFEDIGLNVTYSVKNVRADVSLNEDDVFIKINYPIIVERDETKTNLDIFTVTLPIRLKALYDSSKDFVQKIKNTNSNTYTINLEDCKSSDKNGLTNAYIKNSEIFQFVDFSTYKEKYFNSYIFQFAVKNINIDGSCGG